MIIYYLFLRFLSDSSIISFMFFIYEYISVYYFLWWLSIYACELVINLMILIALQYVW